MRFFVSMLMVLALVIATSFSDVSHAMMSPNATKIVKAEASEHGDCNEMKLSDSAQKTAQNDKDHGKCCDKGMCKCVGGNCHGMSKIFGSSSNSMSAASTSSQVFASGNQFVDSALPNRLKRPPRA